MLSRTERSGLVRRLSGLDLIGFGIGIIIGTGVFTLAGIEAKDHAGPGVVLSFVVGGIAALWFQDAMIGVVIGSAMVLNLFAAALAGALIPLGLTRLGVDPAVSSGVFLTTVTDVVGFLAFLGLATVILL